MPIAQWRCWRVILKIKEEDLSGKATLGGECAYESERCVHGRGNAVGVQLSKNNLCHMSSLQWGESQ